jgi:hypothetical protein
LALLRCVPHEQLGPSVPEIHCCREKSQAASDECMRSSRLLGIVWHFEGVCHFLL